jgi:hypothetical protein
MDEMYRVEPRFSFNNVTESYSAIVYVQNTGLVSLTLVQVWIIDVNNDDHQHIDISYPLEVDEAAYIVEIYELIDSLTHQFDLTTTLYVFRVVTERGNIASSKLMPTKSRVYML